MNKPKITKDTIQLDEHIRDIVYACKRHYGDLEHMRQVVADITAIQLEHVDNQALFYWLAEAIDELKMYRNVYKELLEVRFGRRSRMDYGLYDLSTDEGILQYMMSSISMLSINKRGENDELIALYWIPEFYEKD